MHIARWSAARSPDPRHASGEFELIERHRPGAARPERRPAPRRRRRHWLQSPCHRAASSCSRSTPSSGFAYPDGSMESGVRRPPRARREPERPRRHGGGARLGAARRLTLPSVDEHWLAGFSAGLDALARPHGVALAGGDTTRGPDCDRRAPPLGASPAGAQARRRADPATDL